MDKCCHSDARPTLKGLVLGDSRRQILFPANDVLGLWAIMDGPPVTVASGDSTPYGRGHVFCLNGSMVGQCFK